MTATGGDKPIKILDYIPKNVTDTLEGHASITHVTDDSHWLRGWDSQDNLLENGRGVGQVLWSFKRGRDEPENHFGKIAYTCDSKELTSTLQVATEDVSPGRSTHSATSKRTFVDGGIRQFY